MPTYPQLSDKEFLYQKYIVEKNSTVEISKIIGCSLRAVGYALKKFDIECRDFKTARALQKRESFKYDSLNDKNFLHQKYIIEGLSTLEISTLIGSKSSNSVRQALIRNNIEVRDRSDGQTFGRDEDYFILNLSVIEGSLLGDGSLDIWNRESDISYPYFHKKNIHYDHVLFVTDKLFARNGKLRITHYGFTKNDKYYEHFHFSSLTHKELQPLYHKWYPKENNYKKIIPEDINITNELLLHMFMDDGSSHHRRKKKSSIKQIIIIIASECFSRDNQEMFCEKVNKKFGIKMSTTPRNFGTGWGIKIPQSQASLFYEIIGPCPVKSLAYKWK